MGLTLAVAACNDLTGPKSSVTVAVVVNSVFESYSETTAHEPRVSCHVVLHATATGKGRATWSGATVRFYVGADHRILVDTATFQESEVGQSWSANGQISADETQATAWDMAGAIPFYVTIDYRYQPPNRGVQTATVSFQCGTPAAPNAPAPVVTALSVWPTTGELPAGTPITVTYTAEAAAGLWRTDVVVSGPCDITQAFSENLRTSSTRTASISIPSTCALGVPVTVTVYALDALAQQGSRTFVSSVFLADHEPPTIVPRYYLLDGSIVNPAQFRGDFFAGDSVLAEFRASDNHALAAVIWEVLPFASRDSVLVTGQSDATVVKIRLRPEWSGTFQLRAFARDAAGLTSAAELTPRDSARIHPVITRPTRTATVTGETRAIAIDSRRGLVYLAQGNDNRLAVFSMATLQLVSTLALPGTPTDLDITAGGDSLLIVLYGQPSLSVVDLRGTTPALSPLPLPWLDTAASQVPTGVRVAANGRAYLTLTGAASARRMVELNLGDGSVRQLSPTGSADIGAATLERSLDGSVLLLNEDEQWCLQRYDVAADAFSGCVQPRVRDRRPTVDRTASRIAVGIDVYDESLRLLPKVHGDLTSGIPYSALSADGTSLYVAWRGLGYIRLRTSDGEVLDRTSNPIQTSLVRLSPDGTTLVSIESNYGATTKISLIDLR